MNDSPASYRVICFDLDGTLLPMDIDEFMKSYFAAIVGFFARKGFDAQEFTAALNAGIKAMAKHQDDATNAEAYFTEFYRHVDANAAPWEELFEQFYEEDFGAIGEGFEADPHAAQALNTLAAKGYPLVLTTMPMFPLTAVRWRLKWAGINPDIFERITTFENSRSVKPQQTYYAENLAALGVDGSDVLMVGNNTMEDLSFMDLGADAYLITDWMIDPLNFDLSTVKHGALADFAQWVEALPDCENPVTAITTDAIPVEQREEAFARNARTEIDRQEATERAAAVASIATSFSDGGEAKSFEEAATLKEDE